MRIAGAWAKAARPSAGRLASAAEYLSSDRLDVVIVFLPFASALTAVCCGLSVRQEMAGVNAPSANRQAGLKAVILGPGSKQGEGLDMAERRLGIIMNGVTGRMGTNQHLIRSVLAIRDEGGIALEDGTRVLPDPLLVGRDQEKLAHLARAHGIERTTTDIERAIAAGKHIYTEKPTATSLADALALCRRAKAAGVKHGVVQDKLFLPGLVKLRRLKESGFFGRMLSVKGDFGYWVFPGDGRPAQRPSWNY